MVSFNTSALIAEPIKAPSSFLDPISNKNFYLFQYCMAFPMKSFLKETKMYERNICIITMRLLT